MWILPVVMVGVGAASYGYFKHESGKHDAQDFYGMSGGRRRTRRHRRRSGTRRHRK
jgi:hypothetical protein